MEDVFIVSAVRTPTGKFLGALKGFTATELGSMVVGDAVSRAGLKPERVDEAIMGNVVSAGLGQNPARQAALRAGLPPAVAALTINKVCGSGLKAVMLARQAIIAGDAEIVVFYFGRGQGGGVQENIDRWANQFRGPEGGPVEPIVSETVVDKMDVTRVEAGFILNGVDYFSAQQCLIESRKSSPYEIGLGWTVALDRDPFIGQTALRGEQERGSRWAMVGLRYDWDEYEALFDEVGLPPQVTDGAWRTAVPVFDERGRQVGQATSGAWSPLLKQNLALATVETPCAVVGRRLRIEATVEYRRHRVGATVTEMPFFDPEQKRA